LAISPGAKRFWRWRCTPSSASRRAASSGIISQ
jgi:hypothetical protein